MGEKELPHRSAFPTRRGRRKRYKKGEKETHLIERKRKTGMEVGKRGKKKKREKEFPKMVSLSSSIRKRTERARIIKKRKKRRREAVVCP